MYLLSRYLLRTCSSRDEQNRSLEFTNRKTQINLPTNQPHTKLKPQILHHTAATCLHALSCVSTSLKYEPSLSSPIK